MLENCGDIIRAVVTGAAAEPEIQAVLDEGHRRHLEGARTVVRLLKDMRSEAVAVGCHRLPVGLFEPFSAPSHLRPVATGCARLAP
jgi:hypothetical protein